MTKPKKSVKKPKVKTAKKTAAVKTKNVPTSKNLTVPGLPALGSSNKKQIAATIKAEQDKIARQSALKLLSFEELNNAIVGSSVDFYYVLNELKERSSSPLKMKMGQRWYPVALNEVYNCKGMMGEMVSMHVHI